MDDAAIVGLYWQRDPRAIEETDQKYGAFCPVIGEALHPDAASWAYDAPCGVQLRLTLGGEAAYPRFPAALALYETDGAYVLLKAQGVTDAAVLQDLCDGIDFTKLP